MRLGVLELVVILLILVLLVGAKQLPKLAESIGMSLKSFRNGYKKVGDISLDELDAEIAAEAQNKLESKSDGVNVNATEETKAAETK